MNCYMIGASGSHLKGRRKGSAVDGAELRLVWDDLLPRGRVVSADERVGANDVRCG
jgi:hypothetical protein